MWNKNKNSFKQINVTAQVSDIYKWDVMQEIIVMKDFQRIRDSISGGLSVPHHSYMKLFTNTSTIKVSMKNKGN